MKLVNEVYGLTNGYARKGSKGNRKQQRNRMIDFARFAANMGAFTMDQVGAPQVIAYWKAMRKRHLSDKTLYEHWRALCILWTLAGKDDQPPRPFTEEERKKTKRDDPSE